MSHDYSQHPVSISEARGDRDGACSSWTPRDILLRMLRQIDSGELAPDHLMILHAVEDEDETEIGYIQAGSLRGLAQVGLVAKVLQELTERS